MEYVVVTGAAKCEVERAAYCYKVDIAEPSVRLAIEVDGRSHDTDEARMRDAKKDKVLNALGWKVIRVTNDSIDQDLDGVITRLKREIETLKGVKTNLLEVAL